jgi:TM2 domain-containing membrane protein YozV
MFCSACGASNDATAKFCRACGAALGSVPAPAAPADQGTMRDGGERRPQPIRSSPTGKNPVLAAVLSAVIVGVGQFYNGDMKKGAVMLIVAVLLGPATAGVLWLAMAIWSAVDAYQVANGTGKMW